MGFTQKRPRKGWFRESRRHSLARRGIKSRIISFSSVNEARSYLLTKIKRVKAQKQRVLKEIKIVREAKDKVERQLRRTPQKRRFPEFHKLTGVEREALYKIADRHGIARDLIDWQAYIDPTLTFTENKQIVEEQVRLFEHKLALSEKEKKLSRDLKRFDEQLATYITELEWRSQNLPSTEERRMAEEQLKVYR